MSQPFIGEIRMFGGNFAPAGWAFCSGQLLPISENDVLFQLIGTIYGGDGQSTFALPDLQGRFLVHQGTNPQTGTTYQIGEKAGTQAVTLTLNQIPLHGHTPAASTTGGSDNPTGNVWAKTLTGKCYANPGAGPVALNNTMVGNTGGSQPHDNMQPFLVVNYIISLFGIYPAPN